MNAALDTVLDEACAFAENSALEVDFLQQCADQSTSNKKTHQRAATDDSPQIMTSNVTILNVDTADDSDVDWFFEHDATEEKDFSSILKKKNAAKSEEFEGAHFSNSQHLASNSDVDDEFDACFEDGVDFMQKSESDNGSCKALEFVQNLADSPKQSLDSRGVSLERKLAGMISTTKMNKASAVMNNSRHFKTAKTSVEHMKHSQHWDNAQQCTVNSSPSGHDEHTTSFLATEAFSSSNGRKSVHIKQVLQSLKHKYPLSADLLTETYHRQWSMSSNHRQETYFRL